MMTPNAYLNGEEGGSGRVRGDEIHMYCTCTVHTCIHHSPGLSQRFG